MVEKGHFEELHQLLEMLNEDHVQRSRRQNFVFSATLSLVHEAPKRVKQNTKKGKKAMTPEEKLREVSFRESHVQIELGARLVCLSSSIPCR